MKDFLVKVRLISHGRLSKGKVTVQGREQQYYDIFGIAGIDYLELFRKYRGIGYESFALGHIANVELGGAEKHFLNINLLQTSTRMTGQSL